MATIPTPEELAALSPTGYRKYLRTGTYDVEPISEDAQLYAELLELETLVLEAEANLL